LSNLNHTNEHFAYLLKKLGPLQQTKPVPQGSIDKWHDRLPGGLLDVWQEHGIGMWANGKFQLCDPDEYAGLVRILFGESKNFMQNFTDGSQVISWERSHPIS
jgi:hypothetical protein